MNSADGLKRRQECDTSPRAMVALTTASAMETTTLPLKSVSQPDLRDQRACGLKSDDWSSTCGLVLTTQPGVVRAPAGTYTDTIRRIVHDVAIAGQMVLHWLIPGPTG